MSLVKNPTITGNAQVLTIAQHLSISVAVIVVPSDGKIIEDLGCITVYFQVIGTCNVYRWASAETFMVQRQVTMQRNIIYTAIVEWLNGLGIIPVAVQFIAVYQIVRHLQGDRSNVAQGVIIAINGGHGRRIQFHCLQLAAILEHTGSQ